MTDHQPGFAADDETRRVLGASDPAHHLPRADPAQLTSLLEDAMNQQHPEHDHENHPTRTRLLVLAGAAAAVAAVAVVAVTALGHDEQPKQPDRAAAAKPAPTVTALHAGPAVAAKCAAPQPSFVSAQEVAFRGDVVSVTDDLVTLAATEFYAGAPTDEVTVDRPDLGMSEMPVDFQVGTTYLVGATDGRVSICGLSGPATADLQALYDEAFAG